VERVNKKTIDDSIKLRETISAMVDGGAASILIRIPDSFAMPSAVIGYLMKLVNRDKVSLSIIAGDIRLRELLAELQLSSMFGVREQ
jgi:hypothetical protein